MLAAGQDGAPPLDARVDALLRRHGLEASKVGVFVGPAGSDATLVARGAEERLVPASNMKLVTTAMALAALGEGRVFRTELYVDGSLRDGVLEGNLVVRAGGDPNLSARFFDSPTSLFERWNTALGGLRRVTGALILVDESFESKEFHPDWEGNDVSKWYCAPVRGLSLNDNCVDLTVSPGEVGGPPRVKLSPDTRYVTIENGAKTVAKATKPLAFWRRPGTNEIVLRGEVAAKGSPISFSCTVRNPARFFGTVFLETLGLTAPIEERAAMPESLRGRAPAAAHESDLRRTLQVCNRRSQNFYAEMLLKHAGGGSWEGGARAADEFLRGIGVDGAVVRDGSGLSRRNRLSARDLVAVLRDMRGRKDFGAFRDSLAAPGEDGTLRKRLEDLEGRLRAKTGTLTGVSALSGYLTTARGAELAFSVIVNGRGDAEGFQDALLRLLSTLPVD
jgi:D-alanyl-D-alanine carboxypeptidase/D-alanyl-D-alanine-endopeptidase (penicillin-binding protein 4)